MKPYSIDLRERVLADCDAGMGTDAVAQKYRVSPAWVRRLKQRRREDGSIAPKGQRHGPTPKWVEHAERIVAAVEAAPDRTLQEHLHRLGLPLSVATLGRAIRALGLTVKKKS
jgi:transposase